MATQTSERGPAGPVAQRPSRRRRLYIVAMGIDSLGSGLWMPFGLIFFSRAQHVPLADAGAALTIGGLVGLVAGPLGGTLIDLTSPALAVLLSNVLRAVTFLLYPLVGSGWQIGVLAAVSAAADRLFWTGNSPLLASMTKERMEGLLANQNVIRIVGLGVGAGVAGSLAGTVSGLHVVAYLNAVSYVVAASIILAAVGVAAVRPSRTRREPGEDPATRPGWRLVLRDRPYVGLCATQVLYALAASSLVVILPLSSVQALHGPIWLPSASIVSGNVVLAVLQKPAVRIAKRHSRLTALVVASVVFSVTFVLLSPAASLPMAGAVVLVLVGSVTGVVGEVLSMPIMTAAASQVSPEALKGRYSALFQTSWGLAGVLAPLVLTSLLTVGYAALWLTMAALVLLTIPALLGIARRLPAGCLHHEKELAAHAV